MLDSMTLAVEAGGADNFLWPQLFFASKAAFADFLEAIDEYDECFRITDRWWMALSSSHGLAFGKRIASETAPQTDE